jgi:hypothetical protein
VYPRRFESRRSGYAPACAHEWVRGICEKPKDGDWRACYMLLEPSNAAHPAEFIRVPYDVASETAAIRASALPDKFAVDIETGVAVVSTTPYADRSTGRDGRRRHRRWIGGAVVDILCATPQDRSAAHAGDEPSAAVVGLLDRTVSSFRRRRSSCDGRSGRQRRRTSSARSRPKPGQAPPWSGRPAQRRTPPVHSRLFDQLPNGFSSAVGPYTHGTGTSRSRRYTSSWPRW